MLVCTRDAPDALEASCFVREAHEAFSLRAGATAFHGGAGSWAAAEGADVTVFEEAIYRKHTPPKRTWRFSAASPTEALATAEKLNEFLTGTTPRVDVTFVAAAEPALEPWPAPMGLCILGLLVWVVVSERRTARGKDTRSAR